MHGAPQPAEGGADAVLFKASLAGPLLEEGWRWVREDDTAWSFKDGALDLVTKPGSLWDRASAEPAPPLLLRPLDGANACEVTVTMPPTPGSFGEQAGLFWYRDDDNYAKFVVEWMRDGTASVVLALKQRGEAAVCSTAALDAEEAHEPVRLRLELSANGSQLSGVMVMSYYMRLVGSCAVGSDLQPAAAQDSTPSIGISAHGGTAEGAAAGRAAHLANFVAISVRSNRVQWADPTVTVPQPSAPAPDGYNPPAPGAGLAAAGWSVSPDMTEEQLKQMAALLALNGLSPDGPEEDIMSVPS